MSQVARPLSRHRTWEVVSLCHKNDKFRPSKLIVQNPHLKPVFGPCRTRNQREGREVPTNVSGGMLQGQGKCEQKIADCRSLKPCACHSPICGHSYWQTGYGSLRPTWRLDTRHVLRAVHKRSHSGRCCMREFR